jgi:hypothetical protein
LCCKSGQTWPVEATGQADWQSSSFAKAPPFCIQFFVCFHNLTTNNHEFSSGSPELNPPVLLREVLQHPPSESDHLTIRVKGLAEPSSQMETSNSPILFEDLQVGTVVFQPLTDAASSADDATYKISRTEDGRFCAFSDGSYGTKRKVNGQAGMALVYWRQWLPACWTSARDQTGRHPNGDFVKQAWAYKHSTGSIAMEGIGVLEGIHAANKEISRDLHVLKAHSCTVTVRATTDCKTILFHMARTRPIDEKVEKTVSRQLIKRIKEEMQMLQGHDIKVITELHWCPRNRVVQLSLADDLAHKAMTSGMGYSNANGETWSCDIKSDMALETELLESGAPEPDDAPDAHGRRTEPSKSDKARIGRGTKKERRIAGRPQAPRLGRLARPTLIPVTTLNCLYPRFHCLRSLGRTHQPTTKANELPSSSEFGA